jgi:DNA-binding transcriptional MerR regulator
LERAYWNNEVAERLGMGKSTLRRWCLELEKQGYTFTKGEQDSRAFLEQDVLLLKKIKKLQSKGSKLEQAIEQAPPTPMNTPSSPELDLQAERRKLKQELLQEIKQELLGTEQRILKRLEERDQLLMQHVREVQETKLLLAATEEKKSWIAKLFGK